MRFGIPDTASGTYRGRFAPSPTGPLHFGSLLTAMASYLEARRNAGEWLLRIDDIDPPREQPGAADAIIRALNRFGFRWDGEIRYQSRSLARYRDALNRLREEGIAYGCTCTRRDIAAVARSGPNGLIYPGTCRHGLPPGRRTRAWRIRCGVARIRFEDRFQGAIDVSLADTVGDFVIRRADGHIAYHLAAAVDDGSDGISHVVRGHDLLWCTPPQHYLQQQLGLRQPRCGHVPVVVASNGQKLSKQNLAPPVDDERPIMELWRVLDALRQQPPPQLQRESLTRLWEWALQNWQPERLQGLTTLPTP